MQRLLVVRRLCAVFIAVVAVLLFAGALTAQAQSAGRIYRISFLGLTPGEERTSMKPLLERLHELGYIQGRNMTFEALSAEGRPERLPQLAREAVRARPDVLITGFGTLAAQAAKAATTTIPIVFTLLGDPVGAGLVTSLGRPGGNVTGLSGVIEIGGKQLQLLRELIPGKQVIAVLMNPDTPFTRLALKEITAAAETSRTRIQVLEARTADEVPRQLEAAVTTGAAGLIVLGDPLIYSVRRQISDLAAKARLPAMFPARDYVEEGGLISYGFNRPQIYRRAAEYVDRILKGAKPADLPIEQPTKFELIVNQRAARALGIKIPPAVLAQADEVIE